MSSNITTLVNELSGFNKDIVKQDPETLAQLLQGFINDGSQLHTLHIGEITVFANPQNEVGGVKVEIEGIELNNVTTIGDLKVSNTVSGLLAAGAKFFDAVIYLSLSAELRPPPHEHAPSKDPAKVGKYPLYNDLPRITQYVFSMYFYIMIRAHAPSSIADYKLQPMPKFITSVLGVEEAASSMAEYLASFPLQNLNLAWVKYIKTSTISQEAASRFGLGVAGYRIVSIFNSAEPDKYRTTFRKTKEEKKKELEENDGEPLPDKEAGREPLEDKPAWLDGAIAVARSFKDAGPCWDFHPATRSPNVLAKYGNINKNATNLLLAAYSPATIQKFVATKKLAIPPVEDVGYTEYKQWHNKGKYVATSKMFN